MFDPKAKYPLKARPGYVVLIRDEAKEKTEGGLALPSMAQEVPLLGTVVDHFPGLASKGLKESHELEKGNRVIFQRDAGYDYTLDGVTYHILSEADVMAEVEVSG